MCGSVLERGWWTNFQADPMRATSEFHSHGHLHILRVYIKLMLWQPMMLVKDDSVPLGHRSLLSFRAYVEFSLMGASL